MKIKPEHLQYMRDRIQAVIDKNGLDYLQKYYDNLANDSRVKDVDTRFRWDLLYAAGLSDFLVNTLYQYANDSHVDTALKSMQSMWKLRKNPFRLGQRRVYPVKGKRKPRYRGASETRRKTYTTKRTAVLASNPNDEEYREWVRHYAKKLGWTEKQAWRYLQTGKRPKNKSVDRRAESYVSIQKSIRDFKRKPNPGGRTIIYGRVLRVDAQKTQKHICDAGCKRVGHKYTHGFKPGAKMYGLPNGDILISSR